MEELVEENLLQSEERVEESSGPKKGFKCCSLCMRQCFETHGDNGRREAEELFAAPSFITFIKSSHIIGSEFLEIPITFMEKQECNIGHKLSLKGVNGFECEGTVERRDGGCKLITNFHEIVESHKVEVGDLLVFNLIANSTFLIKAYGKCGNEKRESKDFEDMQQNMKLQAAGGQGHAVKFIQLPSISNSEKSERSDRLYARNLRKAQQLKTLVSFHNLIHGKH